MFWPCLVSFEVKIQITRYTFAAFLLFVVIPPVLPFFSCFQVVTNSKNTVQGFKKFHGRAFADPYVQAAKSNLVYDLAQMPSGSTGIKVGIFFFKEHIGNFMLRLVFLQTLDAKTVVSSELPVSSGDVSGGGEGVQRGTGHWDAADQTEGDGGKCTEETCC